eukprot:TRINITY_DN1416_c0_g1_i1.p1 TRINITY_DN1416_c0_g1~~TRINITY_DN1416_c0_g1_i1.p1  ORF type:complete len:180 (-),score=42.71 TRINITY_DN1416_c0_g1_i1:4-543(-)
MEETGKYRKSKDGFFTNMKTEVKSIKLSEEFLESVRKMTEELKEMSKENNNVVKKQGEILYQIDLQVSKYFEINYLNQDDILRETHDSTILFWILNFKDSPLYVKRSDFITNLTYKILDMKYNNKDDFTEKAKYLAIKIVDFIDNEKKEEVSKGDLREAIFKATKKSDTPFEEFILKFD